MNPRSPSPSKASRRIPRPTSFKMKRNISRNLKTLFLLVFTCMMTIFFFKLMRTYFPEHKVSYEQFQMYRRTNKIGETGRKIDWHDYDKILKEKERTGPGEQGKPATLPESMKEKMQDLYKVNGYNGALSDIISLDRSLPDIRHPECTKKLYRNELPYVSVVIPFHNEHLSTLLRTVHAIINRSPEHLIKEIILVDDFSSKESLKETLAEWLRKIPKTHIVRLPERKGLIVARVEGAKKASGQVIIFLDAHTEPTVNWLPPLLDPIAEDYKTCVCPFIDIIDHTTFEYRSQDEGGRGAFNWNLLYKRLPRLKSSKMRPSEPFESPVMAGGLFAISSRFFWELGGYDEGLDIWGGEQYELSFKIWQCGGRMLDAPCSRIGHVYREFAPFPNPRNTSFICVNFKRVAEVWMDEFKELYYLREPQCKAVDAGDLSKQLAIRRNLKCKPFKWFMEKVAFDLPNKFPYKDPPNIAYGQIINAGVRDLCIDMSSGAIKVAKCKDPGEYGQHLVYSWRGDIKMEGGWQCWDIPEHNGDKIKIQMLECHEGGGNQMWNYSLETNWIFQIATTTKCLDYDITTKDVFLQKCDKNSQSQKWILSEMNSTQLLLMEKLVQDSLNDQ